MNLTADGCRQRRERLIDAVETDLIIISNPRHIFYLTNFFAPQTHLGGWGTNYLMIDANSGQSTLLLHNFAAQNQRNAEFADEIIVWDWYDAANHSAQMMFPQGLDELNTLLKTKTTDRVGIEMGSLPYGAAIGEAIDITPTLLSMRRSKDADELVLIRAVIKAVEAGHAIARKTVRAGISELEVYTDVYAAIAKAAGQPVQPLGDFAQSERGGGAPTDYVLHPGEMMILDIFPILNGYRADFTATLAVDDTLTEQQQRLEDAIHAAFAAGEAELKPGNTGKAVYQAVRGALAEHDFADGFGHHAGHGLGLGHPEAPFFVPESVDRLQAGDVVTLEPGSYGQGFGARVEHNYRITEDGFERLTDHKTTFLR